VAGLCADLVVPIHVQGAGEILGDILEAMNKTGPTENGKNESFEDLQRQFEELFLRPPAPAPPTSSSFRSAVRDCRVVHH
jgi:hypothetical protein